MNCMTNTYFTSTKQKKKVLLFLHIWVLYVIIQKIPPLAVLFISHEIQLYLLHFQQRER